MNGIVYVPRSIVVGTGAEGRPVRVGAVGVEAIREEWLVEDRWWSAEPIVRRYFEVVLATGRCEVVFAERGRWFAQRA